MRDRVFAGSYAKFPVAGVRLNRFFVVAAAFAAMSPSADAGGRPSATAESLFPLSSVCLTGGPLKWQQEQNRRYLLRLEPDRLLSRFRSEAGLKPKAPPYGGWENSTRGKYPLDLPGHILGFYMSGAAMTVEATGDEELRRRLLYIVDELAEVQNAHGDGYLLPTRNGRKVFSEIVSGDIRLYLYGRRGTCGHINGCFAPVYVANKILLGLWRIRVATGSDKAWKVLLRFSDWIGANVVDKLDDAALQRMLVCEHGSIPETFAYAFAATGDAKYRRWAERLLHREPVDALAAGKKDDLVYRHGNLTIPKFTAAERVSRITGDEALHRAAANAWNAIVQDHTWANGANAHYEHWFPKGEFEEKLYTGKRKDGPESCNSVNMLRLTEALFETEPTADKVDYYECVLFNHLLATHEPILGRTAYITPLWPGASRSYSHEFDSMWCCTGTGFEAPGKYAQMLYSRSTDGGSVRVNLFAPSTLDWTERGARLRQETAFPYGESARIRIEKAGADPKFAVLVRRPAWARNGFTLRVNGQVVQTSGCGYVSIAREWRVGDCIDIDFPMSLWTKPLPGSVKYAAFFYGPLLLAADYGTAGRKPQDYIANPADTTRHTWRFSPVEKMPSVPAAAARDPSCCLERTTGGPAAFRLKGGDTLLMPMCDLHFRRYNVYWRLSDTVEDKAFADAAARDAGYAEQAVDSVAIGDAASEKTHGFAGAKTEAGTGLYGERHEFRWRHAKAGGFFAYRLAVGDVPGGRVLAAKYYARERGPRVFDVLVDGKVVRTENLIDNRKPAFAYVETPIPAELFAGKKSVEVRFVPKPGNAAGGIFGLWLLPR